MQQNRADWIPTRRSLLTRLKDWDDQEGWRQFFDTYSRLIYNTAIRAGLSDAEAQDVVQETLLSVSKKMRNFKYNPALGSFKGWLLQLTRWRVKNQFRKRTRAEALQENSTAETGRTRAEDRVPDQASLVQDAYWAKE